VVKQVNARPIYERIERLKQSVRLTNRQARDLTSRAAAIIQQEISAKAVAARAGHDTAASTFHTESTDAPNYKLLTQLAGVRKRGRARPYAPGYREWQAKTARTNLKWRGKRSARRIAGGRTVLAGQVVGESLAKMTEKGTRHMRPRPFWRSAMAAARYRALVMIEQGLRDLIEDTLRR
jgi:hypothetical protein